MEPIIIEYKNIEYLIKIIFISIFTLKLNYKILNIDINSKNILSIVIILIINILSVLIKIISDSLTSLCFLNIGISVFFSKITIRNIGTSLMVTTISISINCIMYLISVSISYSLFRFSNLNNEYIVFVGILLIYSITYGIIYKIRRLKNGITFLKNNEKNEYFGLLILNIATSIFFAITVLRNMEITAKRWLFIYIVIFSIIMFISIQKSLQLYYKQKLQEREVEEIKEELKNKDKEIKELEKENLKLNKKNHSIAHKQKALEYELEQMLLNNHIIDENYVKDKIENLSKEMQNEGVIIDLTKTGINEVDNMLKYMQSECEKNKIDFQLQINGNIHHMVNTYIGKEELEILIADMIKNAIIAINYSENINKSILVRLGLIDGFYSLYVYDSGIEFEINTLINFGLKASTTHADNGGTGMGLMNTFDTLKKYKASLIIDEYGEPVNDNFTKAMKIIFDNNNTYKIKSYRKEDIREKDVNKRVSF